MTSRPSDQLDLSQIHVVTNGSQAIPSVSGLVSTPSAKPDKVFGGWDNLGYSSNHDEADNKKSPFNSVHAGFKAYPVHQHSVEQSTRVEELNRGKKNQRCNCCSCSKHSCMIAAIIGGVVLFLAIVAAIVVGLVFGLRKKDDVHVNCGENEHQCSNGSCLLQKFVCDKINDCGDNSDEFNCSCLESNFRCDMGMCIDGWRRCDGNYDCPDKSDEVSCAKKKVYLSGTIVINTTWTYEYYNQASRAYQLLSSEIFADISWIMENSSFSDVYFLRNIINLKKGSVLASFRLDITVTNADAKNVSVAVLEVLQEGFQTLISTGGIPAWFLDPKAGISIQDCGENEHQCSDGSCLLQKFVCDKINDCGDYKDEYNCSCLESDFRCDMGMCIDGWRRCDGNYDCPDKSDEVSCVCPMGQYSCRNGTCIMSEWVCDREKDCPGGEDESNCGNCSSDQFQCKDYSCVDMSSRCDGVIECPDISDEHHCVKQDTNLMVQGLSNSSWLPFCAASIPDDVAELLCLSLGMSGLISKHSTYFKSDLYLNYDENQSSNLTSVYNLMSVFETRRSCPNSSALVLQCKVRTCGVPVVDTVPQSLIVHGSSAPPGKWPWQVAIYKNLAFFCGGSLLDQYHVLTAAHCMADADASYLIMVGSNMKGAIEGQYRNVKLIENHPKYSQYYNGYDISVLTLRDPVNYTNYTQPICLTEPEDEVLLSSLCYSTGWGNTDFNRSDQLPIILQEAKMKLWSSQDCLMAYPFATSTMLCAGYMSGYIANCAGDSGGPLVCIDPRGFWKLVGVFSFLTKGCNVPLRPSVFTDVQEVYEWIKDKTTCKFYCDNGKCIWDLKALCDGVDDCGDLTDEHKNCTPSIGCDFEDSYICGYRNIAQGPQLGDWKRVSGPAGVNEGPLVDSTYGNNSGHYMYSAASRSIILAPVYNQATDSCLQFKLNVRALYCGGFRVFIQPTTFTIMPSKNVTLDNMTILFEWPPDFCHIDIWQVMALDVPAGRFILGFEAYADRGQSSASMAFDDVRLLNGTCASQVCGSEEFTCTMDGVCIPASYECNFCTNCVDVSDELVCSHKSYSCDFERYGACGLEQSVTDKMDWLIQTATEAASITKCPSHDHTTDSPLGKIFFISTLYGNPGDDARVTLPIQTSSNISCFRMYYSMISQGRLKVDYVSGNNEWAQVWSVEKLNVSGWQLLQLVLPIGVSIISIDGLTGIESPSATTSYIAIDDIGISEGNCTAPVCTTYEFACSDGPCIYHEHICDGIGDCQDSSDERPDLCVCRPESFHCMSGECLQGHVRCDGIRNCKDNSDELNCDTCNQITEYQCVSDGRCKLRSTWCDGTIDCNDGSDELQNCTCLPEQFRCTNGRCILAVEFCNGKNDCTDGSDESIGCSCSTVGLFRCSNGSCAERCNLVDECADRSDELNCTSYKCIDGSTISARYRCDGQVDCTHAEDEQNCYCSPTDFHCTGGACISRSKVCDGLYDCQDLGDERNCTCSSRQFKCANGLCLPSYVRCNQQNECLDFSDEQNCTCKQDEFHCNNGICLYNGFRCNTDDDCGDGSDELNCTCKAKELTCSDGKCIQPQWICDGYADCKDGSDELNCTHCNNATEFRCRVDYSCIPLLSRCDGIVDCQDGSDEHGCVIQQSYNGTSNILYGYRNGSFYPLCTKFWTEQWSLGVCASLGSDDTIAISSVTLNTEQTFLKIQDDISSLSYNLSHLELTSSCQAKSAVRLTCMAPSCGRPTYSSIVPFIIRGDLAPEGEWPWMAALLYNGKYICSASLISEEWIVTAAHCFFDLRNGYSLVNVPQYFTLLLGVTKRIGFSSHLQVATVRRIFMHPDYKVVNNVQYNDITLLQLTSRVVTNDFVKPLCLPKSTQQTLLCFAAGWGYSSDVDLSDTPIDLRQAKMDIWTYESCSQPDKWGSNVNNKTHVCAGYATGYVSLCRGDSGGPLMCRDLNNKWTLRGIVSTGTNPCIQANDPKPTLLTNVEYFMPWITSIIRQNRK